MSEQTASTIADVIAEYLVNRDDFAHTTVGVVDDERRGPIAVDLETQAGEHFTVTIEATA